MVPFVTSQKEVKCFSVSKFQRPRSPVLPNNIHKVSVTLLSEVGGGTEVDQGRVVHPGACCSSAPGHAETGARPSAGAGLLLFILEYVAQGALAGSHRVLQRGAQ